MLDHHIQRAIVTKLKSSDSLSFTELKDSELDNKLFTYHLKATIRGKFVIKTVDGRYQLTPAGEKLWRRMSESPEKISLRAFCVLYLVVHHAKFGWLLYKRKTHPLKDKVGFMHAIPESGLHVTDRASNELASKTGLNGTFNVIGSGFFRTTVDGTVDGYINFTILLCEDSIGTLTPTDNAADYFWSEQINTTDQELLPNMPILLESIADGNYPFFIDELVGN
jgi:hypothetical protein